MAWRLDGALDDVLAGRLARDPAQVDVLRPCHLLQTTRPRRFRQGRQGRVNRGPGEGTEGLADVCSRTRGHVRGQGREVAVDWGRRVVVAAVLSPLIWPPPVQRTLPAPIPAATWVFSTSKSLCVSYNSSLSISILIPSSASALFIPISTDKRNSSYS